MFMRLFGALLVLSVGVLVAVGASRPAESATTVKVCGSGFGHGVGLSQYGAYGRAKAGQNYTTITKAYYKGVSLKQYSNNPLVRVLLREQSLSGAHNVVVTSGREARLRNLATGGTVKLQAATYRVQYIASKKLYRVTNVSTGRTLGSYTGPVRFEPVRGFLRVAGKDYRGSVVAQVSGSKFYFVNLLPLENYIRGVVAKEMPASWPAEALKAQAVAARSFARAGWRTGPFNFYADTRDQVYGGVAAETAATNSAVIATARIVAVYSGKPITAFFHSSAGGYTEDSAYVFNSAPYLKAVRDVDRSGRPFEGIAYANSPWRSWSGTVDADGSPELEVGNITGVRVLERSPSGRVTKAEVAGTKGKKVISGQYAVRGLNTNGVRRADGSTYPAGDLPSARVSFGSAC